MPTLLICTVGGSPEPLVASLKHWQPDRIVFLPSKDTVSSIVTGELSIVQRVANEGLVLSPGCYDADPVTDAQSFLECVERFRRLTPEVQRWLNRGEAYRVVVDFTGGTKCMTAALALQAHRWHCLFSYVGGIERTKDGVGIVVSGKESIVHFQNPWDALGYQAVEDAVTLFDQGAYTAAAQGLDSALRQASDPSLKRMLSTFKQLAEAYNAWDRFDHKTAYQRLGEVRKNVNDLQVLFGVQVCDGFAFILPSHLQHLEGLKDTTKPSPALIDDLLANARRRADEGRYDDAVARLYRATEGLAQIALQQYGIYDTGKVSLPQLPEDMRGQWEEKVEDNTVRLGLQDVYALLSVLHDALGERFVKLRWHEREHSPLTARNLSILAHGFLPVDRRIFQQLWTGCLILAQTTEDKLLRFPRLTSQA